MNHIFDKRARKNKFCSLWGGSKQKTANSCIECQWAFKKDQAMLLYQITWKKCHKKKKYLFSKLAISFFFYCHIFIQKSHKWSSIYTMGLRIACIFVKIYVVELIIWCSYFGSQEIQITDPICAMWYSGTEIQFAIFWPLIIRAWNQTDLEHIHYTAWLGL